ncbi:MAG: SLC13 family permease [Candidatus Bathyarchaeia archaeon]
MNKIELCKIPSYFAIVILAPYVISTVLGEVSLPQLISLTVFVSFIAGSLFYWPFRNGFALIGISLLLALRVLDIEHLIEFANLDIVLFLVGMMSVIAFLEEKKFFDWLISIMIKPFSKSPPMLIFVILILATIMAALVDEVTSILFMSVIMLKVLSQYGIEGKKTIPFIIFLVFTTNIGSSALPVGNPVGVLIAFQAGLTISDFIRWVFPLAIINSVLTAVIGMVYLMRGTKLSNPGQVLEFEEVKMSRDLKVALCIFIGVLAGLILHHQIEEYLHLGKNMMLLGVPLLGSGAVLMISRGRAREIIEKVDWWTLLYFLLLFASVGTLRFTGVTDLIALTIAKSVSGLFDTMLLVGGVISVLTAFMDNVLAVATLAPVVQALGDVGLPIEPIWWMMLIGGTYCGNATVIGSTANIVVAGLIEKKKIGSFSMVGWMILGVPISILTFFIAFALLWVQL